MRDRTRGSQSGVLRWLGVLVVIAAPLALNVTPAAALGGVGFVSARGTVTSFPDQIEVQFSAIGNCDTAQDTRPFYVRWSEGNVSHLFRRTGTDVSFCQTPFGTNAPTIQGFGPGVTDGSAARAQWQFADGEPDGEPDQVQIWIFGPVMDVPVLTVSDVPDPLNGSPGGVWAFGELPWP
jgi:hypothetical protein